jgi:hypothetical protein
VGAEWAIWGWVRGEWQSDVYCVRWRAFLSATLGRPLALGCYGEQNPPPLAALLCVCAVGHWLLAIVFG